MNDWQHLEITTTHPSTFGHLEADYGHRYPQLVVGLEIRNPDTHLPVTLTNTRPWYAIRHLTGGHANHQRLLVVTPLTPHPEQHQPISELVEHYHRSDLAAFGLTLTQAVDYANRIAALGATCEHSWPELAESYYPFDPASLPALTADLTCADLANLTTPSSATHPDRWHLAVLGPSTD